MKPTGSTLAVIALLSLAAVSLAKADEPSAVYQGLLAKYDANKDGRLDAAEREAIRTDRLKPNPRGRSERRRFRYPDPIVARFDKDDDNELDGGNLTPPKSGWTSGSRRSTPSTMPTRMAA